MPITPKKPRDEIAQKILGALWEVRQWYNANGTPRTFVDGVNTADSVRAPGLLAVQLRLHQADRGISDAKLEKLYTALWLISDLWTLWQTYQHWGSSTDVAAQKDIADRLAKVEPGMQRFRALIQSRGRPAKGETKETWVAYHELLPQNRHTISEVARVAGVARPKVREALQELELEPKPDPRRKK